MIKKKYFAHSLEGKPVEEWHLLEDHLLGLPDLPNRLQMNSGQGNGLVWRDFDLK